MNDQSVRHLAAEGGQATTHRSPTPARPAGHRHHRLLAPHAVNDQLKRRRHLPIPEQGRWLASVVRGHLAYYAVPGNARAINAFRIQIGRHWLRALRRRSQRDRLSWERMNRLIARWLPPVRILHPYPEVRFDVRTRDRSPVR